MKIEIFEGADAQWYWRLRARNGEVMAQSEGYTRRWSARRAARRLHGLLGKHVVDVRETTSGS